MRTVVETPEFQKQAAAIWTVDEHESFISRISEHPDAGDVIPGAEGARKVRWKGQGRGKRGGTRVIYFHLVADEIVLLIMLYAKSVRETVQTTEIKKHGGGVSHEQPTRP